MHSTNLLTYLCRESQGQLSIFIVMYQLQSFVMKSQWEHDQHVGAPNWVAATLRLLLLLPLLLD